MYIYSNIVDFFPERWYINPDSKYVSGGGCNYEKNFKYNLNRKHHNYHTFSLKSSIDQQNAYLALADNIKLDNIKIIKIAMDDYKEGYKKIIESIPLLREEIKDWQDIL